jgi:hypothetical protein
MFYVSISTSGKGDDLLTWYVHGAEVHIGYTRSGEVYTNGSKDDSMAGVILLDI